MNAKILTLLLFLWPCGLRCQDDQPQKNLESETIEEPKNQDNLSITNPDLEHLELLTTEERDRLIKEAVDKMGILDERLGQEIEPMDKTLEELKSLREVFVRFDSIWHDQENNIKEVEKLIICGEYIIAKKEWLEWIEKGILAFNNNDLECAAELVATYDEKSERWLESCASLNDLANFDPANIQQDIENLKENRKHLDPKFVAVKKEVETWIGELIAATDEEESFLKTIRLRRAYDQKFDGWAEVFESVDSEYSRGTMEELKKTRENLNNAIYKLFYAQCCLVAVTFFAVIGVCTFFNRTKPITSTRRFVVFVPTEQLAQTAGPSNPATPSGNGFTPFAGTAHRL